MNREQKISALLNRADDVRRLAMDELDATARRTNTFGSREHRAGSDRVDLAFEQEVLRCQRLDDSALDRELAAEPSG